MENWENAVNPDEDTIPAGYEVIPVGTKVKEGDVVLDYALKNGFAIICKDGFYCHVIGKDSDEARLDNAVFEVFTKLNK